MPDPRHPGSHPGTPQDWGPLLASRLSTLTLAPAREREIIDELSQHLDDLYAELRASGATHDDAVARALEEIDERDLLAREMRSLRQSAIALLPPPGAAGGNWARDAVHDVRYALRTLTRARSWSLVIVLLLALGIGANAAIFAAADAVFRAPVPIRDPDTLVRLRWTGENDVANELDEYGYIRPGRGGKEIRASFSYPMFTELANDARAQADLVAFAPVSQVNLSLDGRAELADSLAVSGNYFSVLGVQPRFGRLLAAGDDRPDAPPVAIISSRFWQSHFGGDPAIVGKVIRANDVPVTIVGVTPPEFVGVQAPLAEPTDITFPITLDVQLKASGGRSQPSFLPKPTAWWINVVGRLHPGTTAAQLQASLGGAFQRTARTDLDAYMKSLSDTDRAAAVNKDRRDIPELIVEPGRRGVYDIDNGPVTAAAVLSAVVLVILLIICANVANLVLARAIARQREFAVRLSLGATRGRLVRQQLTEALLLALAGGSLGVLVAIWGVRLLPPPVSGVGVVHGTTVLFTIGAALATTLLFGAIPALRSTRADVNTRLKDAGRGIVGSHGALARALLVAQVALSLVLLVGAGLFLQTLRHLRSADVGFDPANLVLVRVNPTVAGYDLARTVEAYGRLLERFRAIPGVTGAALSQPALLSGSVSSGSIYVQGRPQPLDIRGPNAPRINRLVVSPEFRSVLGIPLLRGRDLARTDVKTAPMVTLINEAAARKFFPGEDPLGKRVGYQPDHASEIEIVGVIKDAKYSTPREEPPPTMYITYMQAPRAVVTFALRTAEGIGVAPSVRRAIRDFDPQLPVISISTQVEQIERRFSQEKLFAQAYALFGAIALLLASIGLFGLMSYSVARRTSEMGIRMALGARRQDVVGLVMRESLRIVGVGVVVGLALTFAAGRLVAALLFGLPPYHVPTTVASIVLMTVVAAIAAYLPARRASRVDPLAALRCE